MPIVEEQLFFRLRDLFSLEVNRLVMFDTTSRYFEGRGSAGLAATGYSRDKRPDRVQVIIAVLMTRDGIPVAHYVFPGNTADINAFRRAFSDLKSGLEIRPMYHWTLPRVRGHIGVCFLALVVESILARLLRDHGCRDSVSTVMEALQQVRGLESSWKVRPS